MSKCLLFLRITGFNLLVGSIPFLVFLVLFAPGDSKVWNIGILTIHSNFFASVQSFVYSLIQPVVLLLILLIGFLRTERILSYGYLIGIGLQIFRISGVILPGISSVDEWEWFFVATATILLLIVLFRAQWKINLKRNVIDEIKEIDAEFEALKEKKRK